MASVTKTRTLAEFKKDSGITNIQVYKSKNDNLYALDGDRKTDNFIGMVADDLTTDRPINVLDCVDSETGQTWLFICNPKQAVFSL